VSELPVIRREAAARQRRETREAGQARGAFDSEMRRLGLAARSDAEVVQVPAPAAIAGLLGVDEGTIVLARRRRMYADGIPVQMAASYLPLDIASGTALASTDPGPGGIYSRLADLGHAPDTYTETVRVRPPETGEAGFLRIDPGRPVVAIRRAARTASGRIVEVNEITLPAHRWELVYEWPAG
jgi:GntR family transcriptional regulator